MKVSQRFVFNRVGLTALLSLAICLGGCSALAPGSGSCGDTRWSPPKGETQRIITLPDGSTAPLLIFAFDRQGDSCDAKAIENLADKVKEGGYTDIYLLCSGWNQGWYATVGWMDSFAAGYERARTWLPAAVRRTTYKPLYVGALFPSDVLVNAYPPPSPSARPRSLRPDVDRTALLEVLGVDLSDDAMERIRQALRDRGHGARVARLDKLLEKTSSLTPPEQLEFADCLLPLYGPLAEPSVPGARFAVTAGRTPFGRIPRPTRGGLLSVSPAPLPPLSASDLLDVWKQSVRTATATIPRPAEEVGDDNSRARRLGLSVPELVRWALRATELHVMHDRAYQVGQAGLGDLMTQLRTSAGTGKVHVVAHSLADEAAMSALLKSKDAPPIDSLLLLSPIVNAWAMAPAPLVGAAVSSSLQSQAKPGLYQPVAEKLVKRSVVVLYSTRDWFASYYAPLALRRPAFEGMASPDAWAGIGNGFLTLGGAGPAGLEPPAYLETLIAPGAEPQGPKPYMFDPASTKVVAIDGSASIVTHGDANDRNIWWLLANQVETRE